MASDWTLRLARREDADAIAAVFSPSYRLLDFLPALHTVAQDRRFIGDVILRDCAVTVAEAQGRIVGFLALQEDQIRLLYVHPDVIGQGVGARLMAAAQASARAQRRSLWLWCFQQNARARRFYEARGFAAVAFTDGAGNEEKTPDVRYEWTPPR